MEHIDYIKIILVEIGQEGNLDSMNILKHNLVGDDLFLSQYFSFQTFHAYYGTEMTSCIVLWTLRKNKIAGKLNKILFLKERKLQ